MAGHLKSILAEFIGTFALVLFGAGSVCMNIVTGGRAGLTGIALTHGLILSAITYRHPCGHFNPALTITLFFRRRIDIVKGVFCVSAQLLGAALAGLCLKAVLHNYPEIQTATPFLGACTLSDGIGYKAATLVEAIASFFLFTVYATFMEEEPRQAGAFLALGATWTASILAFGPLTGAALNPARAFGPAIVTGHWDYWYIYWIGPMAGSLSALWLYENLYLEKKK